MTHYIVRTQKSFAPAHAGAASGAAQDRQPSLLTTNFLSIAGGLMNSQISGLSA